MGLPSFISRCLKSTWKRLRTENVDPLELPEPVRKGVYETRDRMFSPFVEGKEVLELGCGYGYSAFLFSKGAKAVVGVDIDEETIARARQRYRGRRNLSFITDDALGFLEKTRQRFDVVALFEFIEHIDATEQGHLLKRIGSILKAGGRILISTPNGRVVPFFRRNPYHTRELSVRELLDLLADDFEVEEIRGQIPLAPLFVPVPWSWLQRLWIWLGVCEKIYRLTPAPEDSRTILLRAVKRSQPSRRAS